MTNQLRTALVVLFALVLTACGGGAPPPTATPQPTPKPLIEFGVQLSWEHTIEFAGMYIAERDGLYAAAGLKPDLRPAFNAEGYIGDAIPEVLAGNATFGVASADSLMAARAEGQPVVAVASIYQRSPIALLSLASTNIVQPADLVGKTVTVSGASRIYLDAMLKNVQIDPATLNIVERTDFSTGELTSGTVDAIDAYITNEPSTLASQNIPYNLMLFADYGVDGYSNLIFVTEETLANQPQLVEDFVRATLRGYQLSVEDPEKSARLSVEYNSTLNYENEVVNMRVSIPLIDPADHEIGEMTPELWQISYTILQNAGTMPADFDVSPAYTLTILDKIYP